MLNNFNVDEIYHSKLDRMYFRSRGQKMPPIRIEQTYRSGKCNLSFPEEGKPFEKRSYWLILLDREYIW